MNVSSDGVSFGVAGNLGVILLQNFFYISIVRVSISIYQSSLLSCAWEKEKVTYVIVAPLFSFFLFKLGV